MPSKAALMALLMRNYWKFQKRYRPLQNYTDAVYRRNQHREKFNRWRSLERQCLQKLETYERALKGNQEMLKYPYMKLDERMELRLCGKRFAMWVKEARASLSNARANRRFHANEKYSLDRWIEREEELRRKSEGPQDSEDEEDKLYTVFNMSLVSEAFGERLESTDEDDPDFKI